MRSLVTLLLVMGLAGSGLLVFTFWRNRLPWTAPPGPMARLIRYATTHVAETVDGSPYPELRPRRYPGVPPEQLFGYVEQAVGSLAGWRVVKREKENRVLHAVVTTPLVHFEDDVDVAVAPAAEHGAVLQMRSASRVGQGDLGTNTAHILQFYRALDRLVPPPVGAPGRS